MFVTGVTTSRIEEIRKYKVSEIFEENFFQFDASTNTGLFDVNWEIGEIVYFINNIKYVDYYDNGKYVSTYFELTPNQISERTGGNLIKNENHLETVQKIKIKKDIFINRNEKSVLRDNNMLTDLNSIVEIETFVGGNYFNVYKN